MSSSSKHFVDAPEDAVSSSLLGLVHASSGPELKLLSGFPEIKVVVSSDFVKIPSDERPVSLISGGGSGHEPGQAGYVGPGMLSAAVCGDIFASPSAEAVYWAIKATTGKAGCLLIVMNYTGDRLNFGLAAERAKAEGLKVEMVVVGEDVALPSKKAGRRGLAGTILIHKICGAAAATKRKTLSDICALAKEACDSMGTMGVSLTTCNIPGQPASTRLAGDEMEVGLGIHGEPGRKKAKLQTATEIVQLVVDAIAKPGGNEYFQVAEGSDVILLINNLGSTTSIEMGLVAEKALKYCTGSLKLSVKRLLVGSFKTALDMAGISITLMKNAPSFLSFLDLPTDAPAWPKSTRRDPTSDCFFDAGALDGEEPAASSAAAEAGGGVPLEGWEQQVVRSAIRKACEEVVKCQKAVDDLDRLIGDGDCGSTMKKGGEGILKDMDGYDFGRSSGIALGLAQSVLLHMGGTSGAIYNIFFTAAQTSLASAVEEEESCKYAHFVRAFKAGVDAIQKYGGAGVGDRTLVDALHPFAHSLDGGLSGKSEIKQNLEQALLRAEQSAERTKSMTEAILGRSSYVPEDALKGNADPGAVVACKWIAGFVSAL